ncbi:MAG: hypothetical protein JO127_04445 [Caulobacteraceae bacterium]|nr:hypothetical protein [Caulobacteraceae bacterium]
MIGLQLALPSDAPDRTVAGLAPRRAKPISLPALPDYPAVLAAPLFAPDRQPGGSGDQAAGEGGMGGYAALGVATGGSAATAVVSAPGGKIVTLRPGDSVDDWKLVSVSPTRLAFERKGVRQDLVIGAAAGEPASGDEAADK